MKATTLRVLARPAVAVAFELAGVPVVSVADPRAAGAEIEALSHASTTGLILLEESLHASLRASRHPALRRQRPIVIPFPGPTWDRTQAPADEIVEILRRAIGYQVRLV